MAATASSISMTKHVQEMSIDGDEPPPSYIVKDRSGIADPSTRLIQIPVIDISLLSSSSNEGREELEKLKAALGSLGCFQAIGHGIPNSVLDKVRKVTKQFFALPVIEKEKCARPADGMEGYGNYTNYSDTLALDWCDVLTLGFFPQHSRKLELWPTNPTEFREIMNEYSVKMKFLVELLVKAMARSLSLQEDCFLKQYAGGQEILAARFNSYPVCSRPDLVLGLTAHSDGCVLAILLQDKQVEGLQVFKDDQWFRVPVIPHALVVIAGDIIEIMSNGIFKSPLHRVSVSSEEERISVAAFTLPTPEVEIGPVMELIDENRPQHYRKLRNYGAVIAECFQNGKVPLDAVRI